MEIKQGDIVLCSFYFSDMNQSKDRPVKSKLMIRKTFVVSKAVVLKKYESLNSDSYNNYHQAFCKYFGCSQ